MRSTDRIVSEARRWIGSPYVHQHRQRGHAVDCVGLVIGVGLAADVLPTWTPEAWAPHASYGRTPNPAHMQKAIAKFLTPLDLDPMEAAPDGSVAFMGWRPGGGCTACASPILAIWTTKSRHGCARAVG